jgi:hypothetical protein
LVYFCWKLVSFFTSLFQSLLDLMTNSNEFNGNHQISVNSTPYSGVIALARTRNVTNGTSLEGEPFESQSMLVWQRGHWSVDMYTCCTKMFDATKSLWLTLSSRCCYRKRRICRRVSCGGLQLKGKAHLRSTLSWQRLQCLGENFELCHHSFHVWTGNRRPRWRGGLSTWNFDDCGPFSSE